MFHCRGWLESFDSRTSCYTRLGHAREQLARPRTLSMRHHPRSRKAEVAAQILEKPSSCTVEMVRTPWGFVVDVLLTTPWHLYEDHRLA